jgi:outer membrane protein OmpA-like peptidoglycan-associated protein
MLQAFIGIHVSIGIAAIRGNEMINSRRAFIAACGMIMIVTLSYAQGWRGLKPLHSTRKDVERLIGPPIKQRDYVYELENERVNIVYSDGTPCTKGWPDGWNVPADTVLSIRVYPKTKLSLADLRIDLGKYNKFNDPHLGGITYYSNIEEGGSIQMQEDGERVRSISYSPAQSDNHLRCPDAAAREAEIERGESAYLHPELYYSDVSPKEEKVRLEYFADQLQQHPPQSKVYIIGYADQCASINEAQTRANQAKNYLVNKLGIEKQRIVTIDGGHRIEVRTELYIIHPNKPKPLASPNIHPKNVHIIKKGSTKNVNCSEKRRLGHYLPTLHILFQ